MAVREQGAKESIWSSDGGSNGSLQKAYTAEVYNFYCTSRIIVLKNQARFDSRGQLTGVCEKGVAC
jgi:hypothetical protein